MCTVLTKPARPIRVPERNAVDLDRVVFDPEYRARIRKALNRAPRKKQIKQLEKD